MPHETSDKMTELAIIMTQLDAAVSRLREIWLGLTQTHAIIAQATLTYRQSLERLNGKTLVPQFAASPHCATGATGLIDDTVTVQTRARPA